MLDDELDEIARRTGLHRGPANVASPPRFVHQPTEQEFVLVPGGVFAMGMSGAELCAALRRVRYDPDLAFWREAHARMYARAQPVHRVTVRPFLVGRSPLLGGTADRAGVQWSTHETSEHRGDAVAAAMSPANAVRALGRWGWRLPSEAQWEYVARAGGADAWAGGSGFATAIDAQVHDPRFHRDDEHCSAWGIWGLGLGEWVADDWHDDYVGAPADESPWRDGPGAPSVHRGGGVLRAPWQDSDEALSCHAAVRGGLGAWRGVFVARPVIALPWLGVVTSPPVAVDDAPSFDEAVAVLDAELRAERAHRRRTEAERRARTARVESASIGTIERGTVRSAGGGGVYIVRLVRGNGVLRLPPEVGPLQVGDPLTVRIVGAGSVPDLELVSLDHE